MNRGVIVPNIGEDWIAGGVSGITFEDRKVNWDDYLPTEEVQFSSRTDFMDCVSESFDNVVETQMNWMLKTGQFTDAQIKEMTDLNYFDFKGNFNFSDRFLAKMSGTTKQGNSQNTVADTARKFGLIGEKDWAKDDTLTWDEFYKDIPQELKDKALKIFRYVSFSYEWVVTDKNPISDHDIINNTLQLHVKQAPIQLTIPICPQYNGMATIPTCPKTEPCHAIEFYGFIFWVRKIFDTYNPFRKTLAEDYPIPYALKILVNLVPQDAPVLPPNPTAEDKQTFFIQVLAWLYKVKNFLVNSKP